MNYPITIVVKKAEEELKRAVIDIENKYSIPPDIMAMVYSNVHNYIHEKEISVLNDICIGSINELSKLKEKEDEACQST